MAKVGSACPNSDSEAQWSVSWNPADPEILACCGSDKTISIYRALFLADGNNVELSLISQLDGQHNRTLRSVQFSCNGLLACASFDSTVSIYKPCFAAGGFKNQLVTGYDLMCVLDGHENEVKSVAWSPSGTLLATCGRDKSVWIWALDLETDEFECVAVLQEHTQDVKMVKWHPVHDNLLVSCSYDDSIKIWLEDPGDEDWFCAQTLNNHHSSTVWAVDFTADGSKLVSVGDDLAVNIYDIMYPASGSSIASVKVEKSAVEVEKVHTKPIYTVSIMNSSTDSTLIATGAGDDQIAIFKLDNNGIKVSVEHSWKAHEGDVNCVAWNPRHSDILASVGDDGFLNIWRYTCSNR